MKMMEEWEEIRLIKQWFRWVRDNNLEEVNQLINEGIDVNVQDEYGSIALLEAAWCGHVEMMDLLLAKGANIDYADRDGNTAVMKAAFYGHVKAVHLLLAKDANIEFKEKFRGRTALDLAKQEIEEIRKGFVGCDPSKEQDYVEIVHLIEKYKIQREIFSTLLTIAKGMKAEKKVLKVINQYKESEDNLE